ncbi:MAG: hypothetical protein ACOVNK_02935 [Sphingorhabdus lacus]
MLITKKAYLAAALTSASLAALAMPTSAWGTFSPDDPSCSWCRGAL